MPVMPGCSLAEPTLATQPVATVGARWRGTIRIFMPLSRTYSWGWIGPSWSLATAGAVTMARTPTTRTARARPAADRVEVGNIDSSMGS